MKLPLPVIVLAVVALPACATAAALDARPSAPSQERVLAPETGEPLDPAAALTRIAARNGLKIGFAAGNASQRPNCRKTSR
jgi:hypothetical protein